MAPLRLARLAAPVLAAALLLALAVVCTPRAPAGQSGAIGRRALLAAAAGEGFAWAPSGSTVDTPWVWSWQNWLGMLLSVGVSLISGPGGQGGASFYIPLFNVLLGFGLGEAAAMASFVVFVGCLASTSLAVAKPHPNDAARPLIDYTTVLVMTPCMLLGVTFGVIGNRVMPSWLLNVLLVAVWTWSMVKMARGYRGARARELRAKAAAAAAAETGKALESTDGAPAGGGADVEAAAPAAEPRAGLAARVRAWAAKQPWAAVAVIAGLFAGLVSLTMARNLAFAPCSAGYWALLGAQGGALAAVGLGVTLVLLSRERAAAAAAARADADADAADAAADAEAADEAAAREAAAAAAARGDGDGADAVVVVVAGAPAGGARAARKLARRAAAEAKFAANEDAIQWDARRLVIVPPVMLLIGLLAGMLGIGGAAFVSPIILAWGLQPQSAAGTSKLVLALSTGSAALSYLAAGQLNLVYALTYALINAVATPVGVWLMDRLVRRTGRPSFITLLLLARTALGVLVQVAFSAVPAFIYLATQHPDYLGFTPGAICAPRA